jgi:hypothetical protein
LCDPSTTADTAAAELDSLIAASGREKLLL